MGKTITVKDLVKCKYYCLAFNKFGCYLCECGNKVRMEDNKEPNKLIYKEG